MDCYFRRARPHGDLLTAEEFSALKGELQRRFAHLTEWWGGAASSGWQCPYCGEWRVGRRIGRDPSMCEGCFIDGVCFEDAHGEDATRTVST